MTRILVVDDSTELLELFTFIFKAKGYDIATASTKKEVFKKLSAYKPALILLDVKLKDEYGTDICKAIKQDKEFASIPVILISANKELLDGYEDCQADGVLEKPFKMEELLQLIEKHSTVITRL